MKKGDLNKLAQKISKYEGGAVNLSVAQIKEVIRYVALELYLDPFVYMSLLNNGKGYHEEMSEKKPAKKRKAKK